MPRSIDGHGRVSVSRPPPIGSVSPFSFLISAFTPVNTRVADPGFVVVRPGSGVIMMAPVSVCHHVSTIGQRPPPMTFQYQTHASGLIGSPTLPSRRSEDRSQRFGNWSPQRTNVRRAVGAVQRIVTPYFSTIRQNRSLSGKSGVPSYMTTVAPLESGP